MSVYDDAMKFAVDYLKTKANGGFSDARELYDILCFSEYEHNPAPLISAADKDHNAYRQSCAMAAWLIKKGSPLSKPLRSFVAEVLEGKRKSPRKPRGARPGAHGFRDLALASCVRKIEERFGIKPTQYDFKEDGISGVAITAIAADSAGLVLGRDSKAYSVVYDAWSAQKSYLENLTK